MKSGDAYITLIQQVEHRTADLVWNQVCKQVWESGIGERVEDRVTELLDIPGGFRRVRHLVISSFGQRRPYP